MSDYDYADRVAYWQKLSADIEQQRVLVFKALANLTDKYDAMTVSRNSWRVAAIALGLVHVASIVNVYFFGGAL